MTTPARARSAPADQRRRDLAAIHAAAAKLGLDTADKSPASTYRTIVATAGAEGTSSAANLSPEGRRRVLAYLLRQANPQSNAHPHGWQAGKINRLWAELGQLGALNEPGEASLLRFVKATAGVDSLRFLTAASGSRVIEALKAWRDRATRTKATA